MLLVRRVGLGPFSVQCNLGAVVQQARLAFLWTILLQAPHDARGSSLFTEPRYEEFIVEVAQFYNNDLESLWSMWNWLQSVTSWPLLPTPPSSGFLGMMLLLHHCSWLHVFEYIPSMRLTKRCHYYDIEDNLGCTLGDWHPLSAEKLASLNLNIGTDLQVYKDGYITIPGFSSCDN